MSTYLVYINKCIKTTYINRDIICVCNVFKIHVYLLHILIVHISSRFYFCFYFMTAYLMGYMEMHVRLRGVPGYSGVTTSPGVL